jgi:DNA-binding PadR family transcriptional regulator
MRRRGVRQAILAVLLDEPMHGYQVIQDLEARSGGRWRPSAGSVYPTLQQLEDEGLVRGEEQGGRRVYTLTDAGRTAAQESPLHRHPWFSGPAREEAAETRDLIAQLVGAAVQVRRAGSAAAQDRARMILIDARRQLYRLLAEDDAAADGAGVDGADREDAPAEAPAETPAEPVAGQTPPDREGGAA